MNVIFHMHTNVKDIADCDVFAEQGRRVWVGSGKIVIFSILTEKGLLKIVMRLSEGIRIIYMDS